MTVAALSTAAQVRISSQALIQLTNDDATATSINTTRLDACCSDAIGDFESITGMTHDTSIAAHLSTLVTGVLYYLEKYKCREGALMNSHMKQFYGACEGFRRRAWASPSTTSTLTPTRDTTGATPDMDRSKKVWQSGGTVYSPQEYADFSEY